MCFSEPPEPPGPPHTFKCNGGLQKTFKNSKGLWKRSLICSQNDMAVQNRTGLQFWSPSFDKGMATNLKRLTIVSAWEIWCIRDQFIVSFFGYNNQAVCQAMCRYTCPSRVPNAGGGFLSRETGARIFYSASWIFQKKPHHADGRPQSKVRN